VTGPPINLGYKFEPVPRRARQLRRDRLINEQRFDILAFICGRASFARLARRLPTPKLTLVQIAEGVAWRRTQGGPKAKLNRDSLYWHLRVLAKVGLLSWTVEGRDVYVFTLHPDAPADSDETQTSAAVDTQTSATAARRSRSHPSASVVTEQSEVDADASASPTQASAIKTQTSGHPGTGAAKRVRASTVAAATQTSSELQKRQTFNEEEIEKKGLSEGDRAEKADSQAAAACAGRRLVKDVLAAVNRARVGRGEEPLLDDAAIAEQLAHGDEALLDRIGDETIDGGPGGGRR